MHTNRYTYSHTHRYIQKKQVHAANLIHAYTVHTNKPVHRHTKYESRRLSHFQHQAIQAVTKNNADQSI